MGFRFAVLVRCRWSVLATRSLFSAQVLFKESVSESNRLFVPAVVARLFSSHEQNGLPDWIEGVQDAIRTARVLYPQLAHLGESRAVDLRTVREAEGGARSFEHGHFWPNAFLLGLGQVFVPFREIGRDDDRGSHG